MLSSMAARQTPDVRTWDGHRLGKGLPVPSVPEPRRVATLADVAGLAGVTVGTASKALNGRGSLRAETRQRVLEAAEQLGFSPNPLAQGLLAGRSWTVGLITTDSIGRFSIPVLLGAEDALGPEQMSVLLCDSRGDAIREAHYLRTLMARRIDGIIVTGRRTDPRPPLPGTPDVPTVYALAPSDRPRTCRWSRTSRAAHGWRSATSWSPGGPGSRTSPARRTTPRRRCAPTERWPNWRPAAWNRRPAACTSASGPRRGDGARRPRAARRTEHRRLVLRQRPDRARRRGRAARERSRVPQDVAIVGYDNWEVMAEACRPPLTTVDLDMVEIGRVAALRLLDAIAGNRTAGTRTVPARLVVRESSLG